MAEEKPRTLKVLEALSKVTEPTSPTDIGIKIEVSPRDTGKTLYDLGKEGLARRPDEKLKLWLITDKGRKYIENPPVPSARPLKPTPEPTVKPTPEPTVEPPAGPLGEEQPETVPSQTDILKEIGERLGVGRKKGEIQLDTIAYFVQRTADLNNLSSVWNALTKMGIANDVKKRWIEIYAQSIPGKEIPEELREKLEAGLESEKVAKAEAGEIPPKPKRFSVINDQIIGDPEGDLSFKEALQLLAQQKGVPAAQANPLAAMVEAMKLGPDMATATLTAMIPIITKEPPKTDNTMIQVLQQRIEQLADDKHKVEMDSLRAEMRSGQKPAESSQEIQALSQQLDQLRDTLHNEQLARIQEQNQAGRKELVGYIGRLEQQIKAIAEGRQVESKIGLMSKALDAGAEQLSGIRQDLKPLAQSFMERGAAPGEKTAAEKAGFGTGLDKGIERAHEAAELEAELFFGPSA